MTTTAIEQSNAPVQASVSEAPETWRVGSLVYTRRGLIVLFSWMLWGDFAFEMKARSVGDVVKVLMDRFHASSTTLVMLITVIPGLMSIIASPIISYKSDRLRTRFGRRRPILWIGATVAAAAMIVIAISPNLGRALARLFAGHLGLDASALIVLGAGWIIFEAASILSGSVFGAFVNDVIPHEVMGRFYGMARVVSLLAGILFMYWLFGKAQDHLVLIFGGIAVLYGVCFTGSTMVVKEGRYPPPPVGQARQSRLGPLIGYFRDCFGHSYYRWLFAAMIIPGLAFSPIYTFNVLFSASLGISNDSYGKLTAFYFLLSMIEAIPLGWLCDRFHPLRVTIVGLFLHTMVALWGGLCIHDARSFSIAFILTGMLQGTWYTVTAAMGPLLLPKAKFAQYSSAAGLVGTLVGILFSLSVARFLDLTHHVYRYTYLIAGIVDVIGLIATIVVFQKFLALGGAERYVAPE